MKFNPMFQNYAMKVSKTNTLLKALLKNKKSQPLKPFKNPIKHT